MEALNDLCKVRRGVIGGLDHSNKDYRQDCNTGEEKDKPCQHSENRMKEFYWCPVNVFTRLF